MAGFFLSCEKENLGFTLLFTTDTRHRRPTGDPIIGLYHQYHSVPGCQLAERDYRSVTCTDIEVIYKLIYPGVCNLSGGMDYAGPGVKGGY